MVLLSILVLKCVKIYCTFGAHTYIILLSAYRRLLFTIEIFVFTILPRVMILCSILLLKCVKISCAFGAHPYTILPSAYRRLLFIIKIKRYLFLPYYPRTTRYFIIIKCSILILIVGHVMCLRHTNLHYLDISILIRLLYIIEK